MKQPWFSERTKVVSGNFGSPLQWYLVCNAKTSEVEEIQVHCSLRKRAQLLVNRELRRKK